MFEGAATEVGTGTRPMVEISRNSWCGKKDNVVDATIHQKAPTELLEVEAQANSPKLAPQSGPEGTDVSMAMDQTQHENVLFRDQNPSYKMDIETSYDSTRQMQDTDDATLENFFSRPLKIREFEWGTGTTLGSDFDPWQLYFANARVVNRIANFNLMRANLRLKVVINGNGFHFGRAMLAYLPYDHLDDFSTNAALVQQDLVGTSQLPKIFLDPTTSTGGEMLLPFFFHKNNCSIPEAEYRNLGRCYLRSINPLKHANGASDQVTISIFAWAEDVQLNVLTSRDPVTILPQSGKEPSKKKSGGSKKKKGKTMTMSKGGASAPGKEVDTANSSGIVSGPATVVMKVANALSFIPQIAPFAMATSQVAGKVASVAKVLGYSRPPVTKNPDPYRPTPTSQLATTTTPDTAIKLTVDDKQELTIDPTIAGVGPEDPLCIKSIASRESYLTSFNWNIGTSPESRLFEMRVSPVQWNESGVSPIAYHFPACAMAALPFKYWTGTMKFRFQVVCSSFHKGRLKFIYDPEAVVSNEYNTNYIEVVDIADTQDFTIEVGNGQTTTLLEHGKPGVDSLDTQWNTTGLSSVNRDNGVLAVYVVNELTTPNSVADNDIQVNVYVSAGDDFEVFVPDNHFQNFVFKPQSGKELDPDSQETEEPSAPEHSIADSLGPGLQLDENINRVFTGEVIQSFRPLLKRYSLWRRELAGTTGSGLFRIERRASMYPFLRGSIAGAVDVSGTGPYNYCNTLLLHWVVGAFSGWRGSIRYKLMFSDVDQSSSSNVASHTLIERDEIYPLGKASYNISRTSIGSYTSPEDASYDVVLGTTDVVATKGALYQTNAVNPTAEFELPYYSPYRFTPGKTKNWTSNTKFNYTPNQLMRAEVYSGGRGIIDFYPATGEDFQVYFFTGMPRMYYEQVPPVI